MKNTDVPIVVTQPFQVSRNRLWEAITQVSKMTQWFFENIKAFEPQVGFKTQFKVQVEDRIFTHLWKITEVVPQHKITYNWQYQEYPGDSFVTFEIIEHEENLILRLTTNVVADFPDTVPEFTRESCIGGWQYFIQERLPAYLKQ
ncbi:SRPBCC domain-containing protein [Aquimarina sp. 2-A2]|uniref:SRPBCC family protein n=1 Tax=Aquimarina sp. 2-A2 TaxID=3382644 RepID=UPI00387F080A